MLIIYFHSYNPHIIIFTPQWVDRNYAGTHDDTAMPVVHARVGTQCCKVADRCS